MDNFKIENICRVCLEGKDDLFSLVNNDFECGDLCQVIKDVAGVIVSLNKWKFNKNFTSTIFSFQINKRDLKFPLKICRSCTGKLEYQRYY